MVTEEQARAAARAHLAEIVGNAGIDVEPVEGGWRVQLQLQPGAGPLVGLGEVFVTTGGTVVELPSHLSPSMARAEFARRVAGSS